MLTTTEELCKFAQIQFTALPSLCACLPPDHAGRSTIAVCTSLDFSQSQNTSEAGLATRCWFHHQIIGAVRPDREIERPHQPPGVEGLSAGQFVTHRDALRRAGGGEHEIHVGEYDALPKFFGPSRSP